MVSAAHELNSVNESTLPPTNKGPHGLGDPDDKTLRKVEVQVLIPKKMREKARNEKCIPEVEEFNNCCLANGVSMVYKCRAENDRMKSCLSRWYKDEEFRNECREEYLNERSHYRKTGISLQEKVKKR